MITPNLCTGCSHLHRTPPTSTEDSSTCQAFPTGIPISVLTGSLDHRQPVSGDHGIQYSEMLPGTAAAYDQYRRAIADSARERLAGLRRVRRR